MKRAFAKWRDFRFLFDPEQPEVVHLEQRCGTERRYWHSCGDVATLDVRLGATHQIAVKWRAPQSCPWVGHRHMATVPGTTLRDLLVVLDEALERGMPGGRRLRALSAIPEGVNPDA